VAFAHVPAPYNLGCLFLNGLPLGMIWGLVFSYLEGRKTTEILGAILTLSFIVANNISKTIAQALIQSGISEFAMPYIVGLIFALPLWLSVFLLDQIPPPTPEDERLRVKRVPMNAQSRWLGFKQLASGLVLLIVNYMLLTAYRDLQSNFASNIWLALGFAEVPSIYLTTTLPMTLTILVVMGLLYLVKGHIQALLAIQGIIVLGLLMIGLGTLAFEQGLISGVNWVILIGTGTYLGYIPFNCFLFERTIAAFRVAGNAGFFMYLADSFGYLGSVATLFYKNLFVADFSWLQFTINSSYGVASVGLFLAVAAILYYLHKYKLVQANQLQNASNLQTT
jgi:MFS family permease